MAHFNAPDFFNEIGRSKAAFAKVVGYGFGGSFLLSAVIMCAGFLTFGGGSAGLILNNYSTADALASVARALFGASILFTFPLAFAGAKAGVRSVLKRVAPSAGERAVVGVPLAIITALALAIADAGVVVAVTGSVCGSAIIYLFPAAIWFATEARPALRAPAPPNR